MEHLFGKHPRDDKLLGVDPSVSNGEQAKCMLVFGGAIRVGVLF
jgi:hypothetical protein